MGYRRRGRQPPNHLLSPPWRTRHNYVQFMSFHYWPEGKVSGRINWPASRRSYVYIGGPLTSPVIIYRRISEWWLEKMIWVFFPVWVGFNRHCAGLIFLMVFEKTSNSAHRGWRDIRKVPVLKCWSSVDQRDVYMFICSQRCAAGVYTCSFGN